MRESDIFNGDGFILAMLFGVFVGIPAMIGLDKGVNYLVDSITEKIYYQPPDYEFRGQVLIDDLRRDIPNEHDQSDKFDFFKKGHS
jgi:hypothetical protein